jgi:hypothetical protein
MIRVFVAALVGAAVLGSLLHLGSGVITALFFVFFILIAAANIGKLRLPLLPQADEARRGCVPSLRS